MQSKIGDFYLKLSKFLGRSKSPYRFLSQMKIQIYLHVRIFI